MQSKKTSNRMMGQIGTHTQNANDSRTAIF